MNLLIPTIVMGVLAAGMLLWGYLQGEGKHVSGLQFALSITWKILPLLLFAFIVAGMIQALVPREAVAHWIGEESGWRGLIIGTLAGGVLPGGPYVTMPLAAGFIRAGAGIGTIVAFLTGWSLIALGRAPIEIGVIGWKVWLIRLACSFFFPPLAGLIAHVLFSGGKWV